MLAVRLVQGPEVELDGAPVAPPQSRRAWTLLAWLALHPGAHQRGRVAAALWPDVVDDSARASLRSAVWALRRALGPGAEPWLAATRDTLALTDAWVDVREAERLAAAGDVAAALELADGELLPGATDDWALRAADEHRESVIGWLEALAADAADAGEAVRLTRRQAALDPLGEEVHRRLMERLAAGGDRPAALALFGRLRERLRRELGVAPSAPTRELAQRLRTEPAGAVTQTRSLPLVGRRRELRELLSAWEAARAGLGGVFVLSGEPGIGKTRLAQELAEHARAGAARVATGAALDLAGGAPFGIWAELLGSLARELPDPPGGAAWPADLARLVPGLAHASIAYTDAPPDVERARLLEAAAALVEWAAVDRPLALVLEDVHAADAASLELAAYIGRRLARLPVLVVMTRRELPRRADLDAVEQELRARGAVAGELALQPLAGPAVAELASSVARLDEREVEAVVGQAEGNALIAVETARAVARGETAPAASLRGAVRVAFRGLDGDARRVAELTAVAARPLERGELAELGVERPADAAALALETGLLTWRDTSIGYRHALLRDAAYADLAAPRRAALHEEVAAALAARPGDRRAAEAAQHLRLAGRDDLAVGELTRAAAHARSVAALDQAAAFLREALTIDGDRADLLVELAEVEAWSGRRDSSDEAFERALPRLEAAGGAELADAWLRRSRWYHGPICYPSGVAHVARRALAILEGLAGDHTAERAEAMAAVAWTEAVSGDVDHADALLAEVEALARGSEHADRLAYDVGHARSLAMIRRGQFEESYAPAIEAGEAAERLGRPDLAYGCWVNAAGAAAAGGDNERALAFLDRCEESVGGRGMLGVEAQMHAARSAVLTRMGRLDGARAEAEAEDAAAQLAGDGQMLASAAHDRGMVALRAGEHEAAERLLAGALEVEGPISRPITRLARAEALARLGRCDEAEAELRATALEPVGAADFPDTLVPRMSRVQGLVASARGDHALAARRLEEAAEGWRRAVPGRSGERLTSVLADFGRPVLGLVDPEFEFQLVLSDLAALGAPAA